MERVQSHRLPGKKLWLKRMKYLVEESSLLYSQAPLVSHCASSGQPRGKKKIRNHNHVHAGKMRNPALRLPKKVVPHDWHAQEALLLVDKDVVLLFPSKGITPS